MTDRSGLPRPSGSGLTTPLSHSRESLASSVSSQLWEVGDRCRIADGKVGSIAFKGKTDFAVGEWIGVILDAPNGKNDGSVGGKRYFTCEPLHGLFCKAAKLMREEGAGGDFKVPPPPSTPLHQKLDFSAIASESVLETPSRFGDSPPMTSTPTGSTDLEIGERVVVNGTKIGVLRFVGETEFAAGVWAGVELDQPIGKNDGSVQGKRYFACKPRYGIFAPAAKVAKSSGPASSKLIVRHTKTSALRQRSGSQESLSSMSSFHSSVSTTRPRRTTTAKASPSKTVGDVSALQDLLKEKEEHIVQLLKERDMERAELTRASQQAEQAEQTLAEERVEFLRTQADLERRVEHLQTTLSELETERKELSFMCDEERKKNEDLAFRIEEESIQKTELEAKVASLDLPNGQPKESEELEKLRSIVQFLEAEVSSQQNELDAKNSEWEEAKRSFQEKSAEAEKCAVEKEKEWKALSEKLSILQSAQTDTANEAQISLEKKCLEREEAEKRLIAEKATLETLLQQETGKLQIQIRTLEETIQSKEIDQVQKEATWEENKKTMLEKMELASKSLQEKEAEHAALRQRIVDLEQQNAEQSQSGNMEKEEMEAKLVAEKKVLEEKLVEGEKRHAEAEKALQEAAKALETQLEAEKERVKNAEEQRLSLSSKLSADTERLQRLVAGLEAQKEQFSAKEEELRRLQSQEAETAHKFQAENASLLERIREMEKEKEERQKQLEKSLQDLHKSNAQREANEKELSIKLETLQKERNDLQSELDGKAVALEETVRRKEADAAAFSDECTSLRNQLVQLKEAQGESENAQIAKLMAENQRLGEETEKVRESGKEGREKLESLLAATQAQLLDKSKLLDELQLKASTVEATLSKELDNWKQNLEKKQAEIEEKSQQIEASKAVEISLNEGKRTLEAEVERLNTYQQAIEAKLSEAENRLAEVVKEKESLSAAVIERQSDTDRMSKEFAETSSELGQLKAELEDSKQKNTDAMQKISGLETTVGENEQKLNGIVAEKATLSNAITQIQSEKEKSSAELLSAREEIGRLQSHIAELEQRRTESDQKSGGLGEELRKAAEQIKELAAEKDVLSASVSERTSEKEKLSKELFEHVTELGKLREEIAQLREKDSESLQKTGNFETEKSQWILEKKALVCKMEEAEEKSRRVSADLEELRKAQKILENNIEVEAGQKSRLEEERSTLTASLEASEKELQILREQVLQTESKLEGTAGDMNKMLEEEKTKRLSTEEKLKTLQQRKKAECETKDKEIAMLHERLKDSELREEAAKKESAEKLAECQLELDRRKEESREKTAALEALRQKRENTADSKSSCCERLEQEKFELLEKITELEGRIRDSKSESSAPEEHKMQISFLNSVIVDQQKKVAELEKHIEFLNKTDVGLGRGIPKVPAPRTYCDICEEFDIHDTEDCPKQEGEMVEEQRHSKPKGSRSEERPYCENCEVFGHEAADCKNETF